MSEGAVDLFVVGTSHAVASAGVRERMHVDVDEVYDGLGLLLGRRRGLRGAVPLSTCARLELYCVADDPAEALRLLRALALRRTGLSPGELAGHTYLRRGPDAVRHLFRVASGLDSVVYGEAQILGQVRDALNNPRSAGTRGATLHRLFERALVTGKRVRTETGVGRGAASLVGAALALVRRESGPLDAVSALVLGAGETGGTVARMLRRAGVARLVIANRTVERAGALARELDAEAAGLEALPALVAAADLTVGAVAGAGCLVGPLTLGNTARPSGPRIFLDLAHPRNFDPDLRRLDGVTLVDLDHVFGRADVARAAVQLPRAEGIVGEECDRFVAWLCSRESLSLLRAMRANVLDLARAHADRWSEGRSPEERERMRRMARSLARSFLHPPTRALREADPGTSQGRGLLGSAASLFGVEAAPEDAGGRG